MYFILYLLSNRFLNIHTPSQAQARLEAEARETTERQLAMQAELEAQRAKFKQQETDRAARRYETISKGELVSHHSYISYQIQQQTH